jgi:hypothetical protein
MCVSILMTSLLQKAIDVDTSVFLAVNGEHSAYWDTFMWMVSDKFIWIPMYCALVYVVLRNYNRRVIISCVEYGPYCRQSSWWKVRISVIPCRQFVGNGILCRLSVSSALAHFLRDVMGYHRVLFPNVPRRALSR